MDQRERLIDAAIQCLQQRGYARTTTRDIVAAAGVHLPAVNYYFGSKEELLKAAITKALRSWTESVISATHGTTALGAREALRETMTTFLNSLEDNRDFVIAGVEAFAQAPRGEDLGAHLAAEYRKAREATAARITATAETTPGLVLEADDVHGLASVLLALFDGLALQWLLAPDQVPHADQVVRALGLLGTTVAAPGADAPAAAGTTRPGPYG
ncbi:TetR/AcrR family transcriptional regulator [Salinactinospora qingdaonensis]|uniref:TetR/AcrR family transcriptional regulator n=1 Tax=Salinactinospora qingdaonensis TaxID=702744 RepID=A0ABP7G292_9ACTN